MNWRLGMNKSRTWLVMIILAAIWPAIIQAQ